MIRKTLWRALTVLTILSMSVPFVYAAPSTAGQAKEQQPAPPLTRPERTLLPAWATIEQPAPPATDAPRATAATTQFITQTIGTGAISSDYPFYTFYENNLTQVLYLGSEIGYSGSIERIAFDISSVGNPLGLVDFSISLLETSDTAFGTAYTDMTGATVVYNANPETLPSSIGWAWFDITDFDFDMSNNLIVQVLWGDNGAYGDASTVNATSTSPDYRTAYGYADSETPPSYDDRTYARPNLRLEMDATFAPNFVGSTKTADADFDNWVITYTIDIENSGLANAANVYLTDTIPANTGYVASSAVASTGTITEGIGYLEWGGTVLSHTTEYLTFTVGILGAPLYDTTITNTATISDPSAIASVDVMVVNTTPVAPLLTLDEDFENGGAIPDGWTNDPGDAGEDWLFGTSAGYGADSDHTSGSGYFAWIDDSSGPYDALPANLLSPLVDLSGYSNPILKFWLWNMSTPGHPTSTLAVDVYDGSIWISDTLVIDTAFTAWTQFSLDLTPYKSNVNQIRFRAMEAASFYSDISIDDVSITEPEPDFSGSIKTAAADFDNWIITYTIAIENSGDLDASNVYLTDTIPANTGYVASSALASSGTITEGVGYLEWGGAVLTQTTEYFTFTVGILGAPLYDSTITNTACISDPMAPSEICTGVVIVTPAFVPDLSTSVKDTVPDNAHGERRAVVGTQFPYTITVSNTGVANATNATLTDDLPTGSAAYVAASAWADSGAVIVASDMLTWTGVVTNGEDVQIGFMMDAISLGLSVDNTAWITGDGALLDLDAPTVGIQNPNAYCEGAIALDPSGDMYWGTIGTYDDDDAFWGFGDDVWFTLTPTATGIMTLTTETNSDLAIGTSDGGCGGTFTTLDSVYGSGEVNVNVNYNQLYYIMVDDTGDYTLTLEAVYEPLQPRLDGWKEGPALVVAGDPIPYTVYAENYGEIPAAAASIVDTFPSGTVGPAMNVVVDGPGSIVTNDAGGLEWNGVLNSLESVTITFELSPTVPCLEPVMTNTAVISAPAISTAVVVEAPPVNTAIEFYLGEGFEGAFPPAGWTNEVVVATDSPTWTQETGTVHPVGYLPHGGDYMARFNSFSVNDGGAARLSSSSVDLSMATDPEVSFWMFHDNSYPTAPDRIQVQVSIDGGTVFTDVGAEILRYDSSGDFWAEHVVDLADYIGESDVIVGFLAISDYGSDLYIDDVTISSPCPAVELSMIKSGPDTAVMGEVITYTILVENNGPVPASGVILTDYLDLGTTYAGGASANHGTLDDSMGASGLITWTGNVTYAESLMLTIPVTAGGECGAMITNTAEITHTSLGAELEDSAATTLVYGAPMAVDKSGPLTATTGDVVQMQIVLSSTLFTSGVVMTDTIPTGMTYAGNLQASNGMAWYDLGDDAVYWTMAGSVLLPQMTGITITFDVTLTASSGPVTNTAEVVYCNTMISDTHTIAAQPPCDPVAGADFDYSPAEPEEDATVTFTGTVASGDAPIAYTWDFGDGGAATGVNATHTFTQSGDYTVWMTATNCGGMGVSVISHTVMVTDVVVCVPPMDLDFGYSPAEPEVGAMVTFTGTVAGGDTPMTYTWNFGDGGVGTGMNVTHVYTDASDFVVEVTVINACGMDTYADTVSTVWPCEALDIDKSGPLTATSGTVVQMQVVIDSAFVAPGTVLTDALPVGMEYAGDVDATGGIAWYDAGAVYWTTDEPITAGNPITVTFDVTLTASGGDVVNMAEVEYCNGIVNDTHTVEVWPSCNPVTSVNFDYSPAAPETDDTVTFTGVVNDGTLVLPVDYSWDFGGGLIKYGNPVTNTYAISNTYAVTVEATNPCTVVPVTYMDYVTVVSVDTMHYIYLPIVLKK
ncbi:MAG: DUF11 domain-containing protein [Chloroflexi bacterium]|nr:DUF11 domain-containing protein [Chloroflexota bacterium]